MYDGEQVAWVSPQVVYDKEDCRVSPLLVYDGEEAVWVSPQKVYEEFCWASPQQVK